MNKLLLRSSVVALLALLVFPALADFLVAFAMASPSRWWLVLPVEPMDVPLEDFYQRALSQLGSDLKLRRIVGCDCKSGIRLAEELQRLRAVAGTKIQVPLPVKRFFFGRPQPACYHKNSR